MWWIPNRGTNPRGFGLSAEAVRKLIEKAELKNNCIEIKYTPVDIEAIKKEYWEEWYKLLKKLASKS